MRLHHVFGFVMLGTGALAANTFAGATGTAVTGSLRFIANTNWFDPSTGHVPDGYGNSASSTVVIGDPQVEFGYQDSFGHITADFVNTRLTVTENTLASSSAEDTQKERYSFTDSAFSGLTAVLASNAYPVTPTVTLNDSVLSIVVPDNYATTAGNTLGYSVMLTLPGDADLNGTVNFNDFLALQASFGKSNTTFTQGNFDGDTATNFNDFLLLQANFGQSVNGPATLATSEQLAAMQAFATANAVPEPATLGIAALAGFGLIRRRQKTC